MFRKKPKLSRIRDQVDAMMTPVAVRMRYAEKERRMCEKMEQERQEMQRKQEEMAQEFVSLVSFIDFTYC